MKDIFYMLKKSTKEWTVILLDSHAMPSVTSRAYVIYQIDDDCVSFRGTNWREGLSTEVIPFSAIKKIVHK